MSAPVEQARADHGGDLARRQDGPGPGGPPADAGWPQRAYGPGANPRTLADCLDEFLVLKRAEGVRAVSIENYRFAVAKFLATDGVPADPQALTVAHAIAWVNSMKARGLNTGGMRTYQGHVWTWLRWMYAEGYILIDVARKLKPVRVELRTRRSATEETRRALLNAAGLARRHRLRNIALIELLWSSGPRRGELSAVCLADVDLDRGQLRLQATKNGRPRVVGVGNAAREAIRAYLDQERGYEPGPLFLAQGRKPMTRSAVASVIRRLSHAAGVTVAAHDFRRGCASRLLERGVPVDVVAHQLGHRSLTMTLIYGEEGRTRRSLEAYHQADR